MQSYNNCCNQCQNCSQDAKDCLCRNVCNCRKCLKDNYENICTNNCSTFKRHGNQTEPMQTDDNSDKNDNFVTKVNVSPGSQYPETWIKLLQDGVNNISFSQVIGNRDEPLYTVLGFFPDKLQVTIDTSVVTTASVQTFVHRNKIIINGKKLECSTTLECAGCREMEVSRIIMIPLPMKHELSKATIVENANIYMLLVKWDLPL